MFDHAKQTCKINISEMGDYARQQLLFEQKPELLDMSDLEFENADEVYDDINSAADLVRAMDDDLFENGKKALLDDLEGLAETLEIPVEEKVKVQLMRG